MKQIFRFFSLLFAVMTSMVAMAGDWSVEAPKAVAPQLGGYYMNATTYYIRNVGSGRYLSCGEAWGTQSTVGVTGQSYRVVNTDLNDVTLPEGQYWLMSPSVNAAGKGNYTLCRWNDAQKVGDGVKCCYADQTNYSMSRGVWVLTNVGNNRYKFTIPTNYVQENVDFTETEHWYYVEGEALGVANDHATNAGENGITWGTYYDIVYEDAPEMCQWEFVEEADYLLWEAKTRLIEYLNRAEELNMSTAKGEQILNGAETTVADIDEFIAVFDKKVELGEWIQKAKAAGVSTTDAEALANSDDATVEQIDETIKQLQEALKIADQWNYPIDITSQYIVNPSPYVNIDGWTLTGDKVNAFDSGNRNAEFWNQSGYAISQTIKDLPAGVYTLRVIAMTRTDMHAVLRAGDASMEIATVPSSDVNSRAGANTWFNAGNGVNELTFILFEKSDVEISLTADNTTGDHWMVWRSFELLDRGTGSAEGLREYFKQMTKGWEEEYIDAYYNQTYYDAVQTAVDNIDSYTAQQAMQAVKAVYDLRNNVQLYKQLAETLSYYGDDGVDGYDASNVMWDSEVVGPNGYMYFESLISGLIENWDAHTLTNEEIKDYLGQFEQALIDAKNDKLVNIEPGMDVTDAVIKNFQFQTASGVSSLDGWNVEGDGKFENNSGSTPVVEQWHGSPNVGDLRVWQKIKVPRGAYRLSTSGWYRTGGAQEAYNHWVAANGENVGDNEVRMFLYGSSSTQAFHNMMEHRYPSNQDGEGNSLELMKLTDAGGTDFYVPNSVTNANYLFAHPELLDVDGNKADWSLSVDFISTGDSIEVGLKGLKVGAYHWTIWDDMKLVYIGDDVNDLRPIAEKACLDAEALLGSKMSSETKKALEDVIAKIRSTEDKDEMIDAYASLGDKVDAVKASIILYESLQQGIDDLNAALEQYPDNATAVAAAESLVSTVSAGYQNGSYKDSEIADVLDQMIDAAVKLQISDQPASLANPVDYTARIVNPKYNDGENGWVFEHSNGIQSITSKLDNIYGVAEGWGNSVESAALNVYQDVTHLPEGVYEVSVRGLFRMEGIATDSKTFTYGYAEENDLMALLTTAQKMDVVPYEARAIFYGNGMEKAASRWIVLPTAEQTDLAEELQITQDMGGFAEYTVLGTSTKYFYPDTRQAMVNRSEFKGSREIYVNHFYASVAEDGVLRIGAKNTNPKAADWFPFTDWHIYYLGNGDDVKAIKDEIEDFINNKTAVEGVEAPVVVNTEIFTVDGRRANSLVRGLNIVKTTEFGGKVTVRKVFVK